MRIKNSLIIFIFTLLYQIIGNAQGIKDSSIALDEVVIVSNKVQKMNYYSTLTNKNIYYSIVSNDTNQRFTPISYLKFEFQGFKLLHIDSIKIKGKNLDLNSVKITIELFDNNKWLASIPLISKKISKKFFMLTPEKDFVINHEGTYYLGIGTIIAQPNTTISFCINDSLDSKMYSFDYESKTFKQIVNPIALNTTPQLIIYYHRK